MFSGHGMKVLHWSNLPESATEFLRICQIYVYKLLVTCTVGLECLPSLVSVCNSLYTSGHFQVLEHIAAFSGNNKIFQLLNTDATFENRKFSVLTIM